MERLNSFKYDIKTDETFNSPVIPVNLSLPSLKFSELEES